MSITKRERERLSKFCEGLKVYVALHRENSGAAGHWFGTCCFLSHSTARLLLQVLQGWLDKENA